MLEVLLFHLEIALRNILVHKKRMVLALLGILFAVMSLVAFGNISSGLKAKIELEISRFGENLIILRAGIFHVAGRTQAQFSEARTLKIEDVKRLKDSVTEIEEVVPFFDVSYPLRFKEKKVTATIVGAESSVFKLRNVDVSYGRFFTREEEANLDRKAVIGFKIYENLFSPEDPIGKFVLIYRVPTEIIGVMGEKGSDFFGQDQDILVYMPLATFMRRYSNVDYIKGAYIKVRDGVSLSHMKHKIRSFIRSARKMRDEEKDDFSVFTVEDVLKTREEGIRLVSILTIIASIISFLIGGLGIFAIMLLSVTERKTEIGIRRAVGSTKRDIIFQFLAESTVVSVLGGILGIGAGLMVTTIVDIIGGFPFILAFKTLIFSISVCVVIGILAGIYPALKGTKYEPVDVLSNQLF
ncbi:MAG: ABC transporter permease [Deltaproteobacteria bacterium]|nr:ABC transporter permease [Deltaproteobacteria bacterium]